jgi:hypothetical protein
LFDETAFPLEIFALFLGLDGYSGADAPFFGSFPRLSNHVAQFVDGCLAIGGLCAVFRYLHDEVLFLTDPMTLLLFEALTHFGGNPGHTGQIQFDLHARVDLVDVLSAGSTTTDEGEFELTFGNVNGVGDVPIVHDVMGRKKSRRYDRRVDHTNAEMGIHTESGNGRNGPERARVGSHRPQSCATHERHDEQNRTQNMCTRTNSAWAASFVVSRRQVDRHESHPAHLVEHEVTNERTKCNGKQGTLCVPHLWWRPSLTTLVEYCFGSVLLVVMVVSAFRANHGHRRRNASFHRLTLTTRCVWRSDDGREIHSLKKTTLCVSYEIFFEHVSHESREC